MIIKSIYTF